MNMRNRTRGLLAATAALLASGCAVFPSGGLFDSSTPVGGPCQTLALPGGPEDLALDPGGGLYVSVSDWRRRADDPPPARGRIFRLEIDPATDAARLTDVTPAGPDDFQPHGIDLWTGPDGSQRLFVVNHPQLGASRVEIYAVTAQGLVDTGEGGRWDLLHRPNDVAAFGPRSFFATNDHAIPRTRWFDPSLRETLSDVTGERNGYVVRVADGSPTVVAERLSLPNGVALSPDGARLYVAESTRGRIRVFEGLSGARLRETARLKPGPGPDNIVVDPQGDLWIGGHNNGLDFLRHATDPRHPSPGRVERVSPDGRRTLAYQSGRKPAASSAPRLWSVSVGAPDGQGGLVVGAIFPRELQRCAIQPASARR
ncbi:SMP-30/gluconolactonase/LRE family protein [Phenylobacterium sp. J426]|uniref:SMP-30/gluconolactonase/LRE family protein n=1 Tax=Phenylobacterium sp. J426 TaxID=2898439 RepID=UPI0021517825|nr:SMP-30/gluconolactonase/LRE family protein [Phenylobacterium sp. J426]MCR5876271.1 SMP-30/gluconolactonase/LRE family protein [Phenylobacterium sp. J426]